MTMLWEGCASDWCLVITLRCQQPFGKVKIAGYLEVQPVAFHFSEGLAAQKRTVQYSRKRNYLQVVSSQ